MKRSKLLLAMCVLLIATLLASCAPAATSSQAASSQAPTNTSSAAQQPSSEAAPENKYPETLSIWAPQLTSHYTAIGKDSYDDSAMWQAVSEELGITFDFQFGTSGTEGWTNFNLLMTADELPDIISAVNFPNVPGGLLEYTDVFADLTDLMDTALIDYSTKMEEIGLSQAIVAADGKNYYIVQCSNMKGAGIYLGFVMREDLLNDLDMETPTTVDEIYAVMKAAKAKYGDSFFPLTGAGFANAQCGIGPMMWPYGITYDFYLEEDGTVNYGPMSDKFDDAMTFMNKLYSEGLIDPDYATQDRNALKAKLLNNLSMFAFEFQPRQLIQEGEAISEDIKFVGITNVAETEGGTAYTFDGNYISGLQFGSSAAITTDCEDVEKAANFLNFWFTEDGYMYGNYGVENVDWEMVDGEPQFTEAYSKVPTEEVILHNLGTAACWPYMNSRDLYLASLPQGAQDAITLWAETNVVDYMYPFNYAARTEEETTLINDTMADINTYMETVYAQLTNGQLAISEIPNVQAKLKELGIEDAIAAYQAAYDRYIGE